MHWLVAPIHDKPNHYVLNHNGFQNIYPNTDWTKEVFRDYAITENITLGANGGDHDSKYNLSVNYWDQQGNVKENDYERFNVFATLQQQLHKNIFVKF